MPVDPRDLDDIAANVAAVYQEAETALVRIIARHLAGEIDKDLPAPAWAERKLAAVRALRAAAQAVIAALQTSSDGAVRDAVAQAFRAGWGSALAELPAAWFPESGLGDAARAAADEVPEFAAIEALANAVTRDIGEKSRNILRDTIDAYRNVITATVARTLTGVQTRQQASQAAWQALMNRGITGFTDRAGRRWQLSSYVEMATRTVTQRAAVQGQTDRLAAMDVPLVTVSNAPQECVLCRPFEGRVLSLDGREGDRSVPHELTDKPITVHVTATLADAMARGLFHPNCRHSVSAYLPGVTKLPEQPTADPDGDKARQQQRALERKIRKAKLEQTGALDEQARKAAGAKVRNAQAALRAHLEEHPELKRLRYREQIGAGNIPPRGRGDAAGGIGPDVQPTLDGGSATRAPRERPRVPEPTATGQPAVEPDRDQLDLLAQPPEPPPAPRDLGKLSDDELTDLMGDPSVDDEQLDAIIAELDRRQAEPAEPEPVDEDDPDAAKWAEVDRLVAEQGLDYEQAYADVFERDVERLRREEAIRKLRETGYTGRGFDELARAAFRDRLADDYLSAEQATNGYLLTRAGQAAGIDPRTLWTQNETYARKWASDELKQWWDENGRVTYDQFRAELLSGGNEQRFRTGGETWLQ